MYCVENFKMRGYWGEETSKKTIKNKNICEKCLHVGISIKIQ